MFPLPTGPFLGLRFRDLDEALAECHALGSDIEALRSELLDHPDASAPPIAMERASNDRHE